MRAKVDDGPMRRNVNVSMPKMAASDTRTNDAFTRSIREFTLLRHSMPVQSNWMEIKRVIKIKIETKHVTAEKKKWERTDVLP